jgi:two-component system sensor histidine kinase MprB
VSLRLRLAAVLAIVATLGIAGASAAAYVATSRGLYDEIDRSIADRTRRVEQELSRPRQAPRPPGQELDENTPIVQITDPQGQVRDDHPDWAPLPVDDDDRRLAEDGRGVRVRDVTIDGVEYRMRTTGLQQGGMIQVARELTETNAVLDELRTRLIAITIAGGAIAALVAFLVARRVTRPIEQLTAAAEHVADTEDLTTPIPVNRRDEIGRLAAAFNAMLRALGASREEQRRLVDDAGHELRTPLTSLRTNLEVLEQADRLPPEDRALLLADVGAELRELSGLVDELVQLSRGGTEEEIVDVRLDAIVNEAVERCRRRTGRDVVLRSEPVTIRGRRAQLDRAVTNLLGNAAKFSPTGTPIEVVVEPGCVSVRDHGPGIAPEDRAHVFERFYRADAARSVSGSGLGLAIVDQVARAHDGEPFVDEAPDGGAVVGIRLPVTV